MKKRLDQLLVERALFPSRTRAQAAIMAGLVYVDGQKIDKAGQLIKDGAGVEVRGEVHPFVGRGGVKLAHALKEFKIDVTGRTALDVGASTGGFTDCLLQNGAAKVYAIDVGYGQLDWKLRNDLRVIVMERTNIRDLTWDELKQKTPNSELRTPNLAVIDVSFISLSKVFPAVYNLLADEAEVVALIKPQFEAKREQVGKGGIVRSDEVRSEVVEKVKVAAEAIGFKVKGLTQSPIEGADGNVEFLIHLAKG
ncbi:MAG: TlyA family RNA methyltransferase [Candidatus Margulisbacteria bacterium]|nr:TlyA family RNA methyltransferase [Candidatus Margulisiibacteriota bacterium]